MSILPETFGFSMYLPLKKSAKERARRLDLLNKLNSMKATNCYKNTDIVEIKIGAERFLYVTGLNAGQVFTKIFDIFGRTFDSESGYSVNMQVGYPNHWDEINPPFKFKIFGNLEADISDAIINELNT